MFANSRVGAQGGAETAHVWLDSLTRGSTMEIGAGEKVVDEGQNNETTIIEV